MTLDKKQEDDLLEQGREMDAERREEHRRESFESIFDSWKVDNLRDLKDNFIEEHEQEFIDFCKTEYNNSK